MKVILYLATSINGHITVGEDGTDWVSKDTLQDFEKLNIECGVVVMGKRTYEMFGNDFPQENCLNIVATKDKELLKREIEGALFTDKSPKEIIDLVSEKGFEKLFLIGGEKINSAFLKDGLIDEIWINIHPIIIGNGKYLFDEISGLGIINLELIEQKPFDGQQVLLKYKVNK